MADGSTSGLSGQDFLPSLLDRLIDHDPGVSTEPAWQQVQDVRTLERSVLRDVESLLNTRSVVTTIPPSCPELQQSSLTFGLPDFTAVGIASREERDRIRKAIQQSIERFEPRLSQVRVSFVEESGSHGRALRLLIEANMKAYPDPVAVAFDTTLEPTTGICKVEASS